MPIALAASSYFRLYTWVVTSKCIRTGMTSLQSQTRMAIRTFFWQWIVIQSGQNSKTRYYLTDFCRSSRYLSSFLSNKASRLFAILHWWDSLWKYQDLRQNYRAPEKRTFTRTPCIFSTTRQLNTKLLEAKFSKHNNSAELPSDTWNPVLEQLVRKRSTNNLCRTFIPSSVYAGDGICSKQFPKNSRVEKGHDKAHIYVPIWLRALDGPLHLSVRLSQNILHHNLPAIQDGPSRTL